MKRFLLFGFWGHDNAGDGGWDHFIDSFDVLSRAIEKGMEIKNELELDNKNRCARLGLPCPKCDAYRYQIVDTTTGDYTTYAD